MTTFVLLLILSILLLVTVIMIRLSINGYMFKNSKKLINYREKINNLKLNPINVEDTKYKKSITRIIVITVVVLILLFNFVNITAFSIISTMYHDILDYVPYYDQHFVAMLLIVSTLGIYFTHFIIIITTLFTSIYVKIKKDCPQYANNTLSSFMSIMIYTYFIFNIVLCLIFVIYTPTSLESSNNTSSFFITFSLLFSSILASLYIIYITPLFTIKIRNSNTNYVKLSIYVLVSIIISVITFYVFKIYNNNFDLENESESIYVFVFFALAFVIFTSIISLIIIHILYDASTINKDKSLSEDNSELQATTPSTNVDDVVASDSVETVNDIEVFETKVSESSVKVNKYNVVRFLEFYLFNLITCGIYYLYFSYKTQKSLYEKDIKNTDPIIYTLIVLLISNFMMYIIMYKAYALALAVNKKEEIMIPLKKLIIKCIILNVVFVIIIVVLALFAIISNDSISLIIGMLVLLYIIVVIISFILFRETYYLFKRYYDEYLSN